LAAYLQDMYLFAGLLKGQMYGRARFELLRKRIDKINTLLERLSEKPDQWNVESLTSKDWIEIRNLAKEVLNQI
jgi:hypothetical protein